MITAVEGWVHGAHDALGTGARLPHRACCSPASAPCTTADTASPCPASRSTPVTAPTNPRPRSRPRAPGSVRRTTSVDMLRPNGIDAELVLVGRGRDLLTDARRHARRVLDTAEVEAVIDYADAQRVTAISSTPAIAGLEQLVGRSASTGFRAAIDAAVAGHDVVGRPVYQLLDDLPVADADLRVRAAARDGAVGHLGRRAQAQAAAARPQPEGLAMLQQADLCAGWKAGGTIMQGFAEDNPRWSPVPTRPRSTRRRPAAPGTSSPARSRPRHAPAPPHRRAPVADGAAARSSTPFPRRVRRRRGRDRRARVHGRRRRRRRHRGRARGRGHAPGAALVRVPRSGRQRRPPRRAHASTPPGGRAGRVPGRQHVHPPQRHAPGPGRRRRCSAPGLARRPVDLA